MQNPAAHIFDFTPDSLGDWCASRGMPAFRAKQILEWVYARGVADPAAMTNLSKRDRDVLLSEMTFLSGETIAEQAATDGTRKLLIEWGEGVASWDRGNMGSRGEAAESTHLTLLMPRSLDPTIPSAALMPRSLDPTIPSSASMPRSLDPTIPSPPSSRQTECVMIPADYDEDLDGGEGGFRRKTACVSSQVGCPVGCKFCASGIGGLDGNLSAGRIVEQVWRLARLPGVERITNVVFMGMGEPLSNFQNVTRAIRTLAAPWGMGIGARKITISTVGLPKAIEKLAEEFELPVTLALSLHAPNDEVRRSLIPWAEFTTVPELLAACQKWFEKTGREITLEYILLRGVNDRPEHARELAGVARTLRGNVNLIRYNEVKGMPFSRPGDQDVLTFQKILRDAGVNVHIRASRGRDIAAACGQLRHEKRG